jgi:Transcriptional Coactivator p15 (PC4)
MNWSAARAMERVREHGAESIAGPRPGRKTNRRMPAQQGPTLPEPIIVDKWWKGRGGGEAVYVRLSTYEGHNLVDIRTWFIDGEGISRPGKGFGCAVKHLPRIVAAFTKALEKAREAGLVDEASE